MIDLNILNKTQAKNALAEANAKGKSVKQILLGKSIINPIQWAEAREALELHGVVPATNKKAIFAGVGVLVLLFGVVIYLLISGSRGKTSEEAVLYQKIMESYSQGKYEETLKEMEGAKDKFKSEDLLKKLSQLKMKVLFQQSKTMFKKGQDSEGLEKLKKILSQAKPSDQVYLDSVGDLVWYFKDRAKKARRKKDIQREIGIYEKAMEYKKEISTISDRRIYKEFLEDWCEAHLRRAVLRFRSSQIKSAMNDIKRIIELELVKDNRAQFDYHYQKAQAVMYVLEAAEYNQSSSPQSKSQVRNKISKFFRLVQNHSHTRLFEDSDYVYQKAQAMRN